PLAPARHPPIIGGGSAARSTYSSPEALALSGPVTHPRIELHPGRAGRAGRPRAALVGGARDASASNDRRRAADATQDRRPRQRGGAAAQSRLPDLSVRTADSHGRPRDVLAGVTSSAGPAFALLRQHEPSPTRGPRRPQQDGLGSGRRAVPARA